MTLLARFRNHDRKRASHKPSPSVSSSASDYLAASYLSESSRGSHLPEPQKINHRMSMPVMPSPVKLEEHVDHRPLRLSVQYSAGDDSETDFSGQGIPPLSARLQSPKRKIVVPKRSQHSFAEGQSPANKVLPQPTQSGSSSGRSSPANKALPEQPPLDASVSSSRSPYTSPKLSQQPNQHQPVFQANLPQYKNYPPQLHSGTGRGPRLANHHTGQPPPPINPSQTFQLHTKASSYDSGLYPQLPRTVSSEADSLMLLSGSESSSDDDTSKASHHSHPYYHEWKQYFKELKAQNTGRSSSAASYTIPAVQNAPYAYYNQIPVSEFEDKLVLNSRRSTLKSSRSASVPAISQLPNASLRAISVSGADYEALLAGRSPSRRMSTAASHTNIKSLAAASNAFASHHHGLSGYVARRDASAPISDYGAYIFGDDSTAETSYELQLEDVTEVGASHSNATMDETVNEQTDILTSTNSPGRLSKSDATPLIDSVLRYPSMLSHSETPEGAALPDPATLPIQSVQKKPKPQPKPHVPLDRQGSVVSNNSYSSMQSEKNFKVGRTLDKIDPPRSASRSPKKEFVPPMPGPPPPLSIDYGLQPSVRDLYYGQPGRGHYSSASFSLLDIHHLQQQIQQLQHMQQLQQLHQMQGQHGLHPSASPQLVPGMLSAPVQRPRAPGSPNVGAASVVEQKINEFIELRQLIAAGNKSFEYRLRWLKMLISATNHTLYNYINIKGEPITGEHVEANMQYFVKSCINHLNKLIKELDQPNADQKLFAEVCFIQGCFYLHAYMSKFEQDFSFEKSPAEAERFFLLALEKDPTFFKAHFELGQLYETLTSEDDFDRAVEHFKESARLGFNKAIYRIGIVCLLVPRLRLTNYLKYFKSLAHVKVNSAEVQLSGDDKDDLEEAVGLAQLQLGKIHEGLYPGDLTAESEFVQESVKLAPIDKARSMSYYTKSANLNCLYAQVKLGRVYEFGELNRHRNAGKSIHWYMKAATSPLKFRRHPDAMLGLCRWYLQGTGGQVAELPFPDVEAAVKWCERACEEFQAPEAYEQMASMIEQGLIEGDAQWWRQEAQELMEA